MSQLSSIIDERGLRRSEGATWRVPATAAELEMWLHIIHLRAEVESLRTALQDADNIMGHEDGHTAWRESWQHLWPWGGPNARLTGQGGASHE